MRTFANMTRAKIDFDTIARRMRKHALSGQYRGDRTAIERAYVDRCAMRVGRTTLVFTRDIERHTIDCLTGPSDQRCWHLAIVCRDRVERDAWLHGVGSQLMWTPEAGFSQNHSPRAG